MKVFRMAQSGNGGKRRKKAIKPPPERGVNDLTEAEWQAMVEVVETSSATMTDVASFNNLNYRAFKKYVARLTCLGMSLVEIEYV